MYTWTCLHNGFCFVEPGYLNPVVQLQANAKLRADYSVGQKSMSEAVKMTHVHVNVNPGRLTTIQNEHSGVISLKEPTPSLESIRRGGIPDHEVVDFEPSHVDSTTSLGIILSQ